MDKFSKDKRSDVMSKIRSKNTKPEKIIRSELFKRGYRFNIHRKDLPGKPDIVLPKYKTVILVHGCFWHLHKDCREGRIPSSNSDFWKAKLERNVEKDILSEAALKAQGWNVITVWECEIEKQTQNTVDKIIAQICK